MSNLEEQFREALRMDEEDWMTDGQALDRAIQALKAAGFTKVTTPREIELPDGRRTIITQVWYPSQDSMRYLTLRGPSR